MKKEKGKTKSEKVRTSLLLTFSLLLFTSAANAAELPEGYAAVEYIESTKGGGQFIDTGYTANGQTKVVFDAVIPVRWMQGGEQDDRFGVLFGSRTMTDWKTKAFALQMCDGNSGKDTVRFVYNGEYRQDGDKPFSFGERVTVTCDGQHVEWTGSKAANVGFTADALDHSKSTLYIFADNTVSGEDGTKNPDGTNRSVMRLYSFKITEGEVVKRDFVPCVRVNDRMAGLYDLAANEPDKAFFANCGTGTFGIPDDAICAVTIGDYPRMTAAWTAGDGAVTNAIVGPSFQVAKGSANVKVIFTAQQNYEILGDPVVRLDGAVTENVVFGEGNDYAVPTVRCVLGDIVYLDRDETNEKMTNATLSATDYELVTSEMTAFADGKWYVVATNVVIENGSNIKVNGSAHLVLCDDASLTIKNVVSYKAAIDVSMSGSTTNALTIYGQQSGSGSLTATGGTTAAGIGGGNGGAGGVVTVNGGTVMATGGSNGAGIGGGYEGAGGTVTVNGGSVTATGGWGGAGIGGGDRGADGEVTLGDNVVVVEGKYGNGSSYVKIASADDYKTVTVGAFERLTAAWTSGDGSATNAVSGTCFFVKKGTENVKVIFTAKQNYAIDGDPVVELDGAVTENVVFGVGNNYAVPTVRCVLGDIAYLDWDDTNGEMTNVTLSATDYALVTAEMTEFDDGKWYVVATNVVIDNGSNIKVNGSAHLILCDNASLAIVNVADNKAAIDVSAVGSTTNLLTIYGQTAGTGALAAMGGSYGAGIGTAERSETAEGCGTIVINGGTVTATGGQNGAGIGGGLNGAGGEVTINGGMVTATGGQNGAGIGGGLNGADGTVTLGKNIVVVEGEVGNGSSYAKIVNTDEHPTVTVDVFEHMTAAWTSGDGSVTNAINGTCFFVKKGTENVKVILAADPEYEVVGGELVHDIGTVNENCAPEFSNLPQLVHRKVEYVDSDGQLQTNDTFTFVTAVTAQLSNGWYLVEGTVSRGVIDVLPGCAANLILADGASLTVRGGGAGIDVQPGEALNIYGQRSGSGRLTASGGADAAGIGGASGKNCGEIIIAGGTVMATGGQRAAGIGGGAQSQGPTRGTIRIMGGYVEAKSASMGGSGIGSGRRFNQVGNDVPPVVISGGTVWASGSKYNNTGEWGADLGRGLNNKGGGSVTITGGSVLANRGYIEPDPTDGEQGVYCVTVEGLTSVESIEGLEGYGVRGISPINGKIYLYLPNGTYEFAVNGTEHVAIVNGKATTAKACTVTPGVPVVCDTAEEATNVAMRAELTPSAEVSEALGSDSERQKYRNMFEFDVVPTADGKWAVEAFLKEPDWTNVVKSAQAATRQIPIADIAALELGELLMDVPLSNCVPGFYYSLYNGAAITNIKANINEVDCNILCGPDTTVVLPVVPPPAPASGFFLIGVLEAPSVVPGESDSVVSRTNGDTRVINPHRW